MTEGNNRSIWVLQALLNRGFVFQTFEEFLERPAQPLSPEGVGLPLGNKRASAGKNKQKTIILRHDVDKLPQNALRFAHIQNELGIKGSYFFRIVPESFHPEIIEKIAALGHEIGYHYEDVDLAVKNFKFQISKKMILRIKPYSYSTNTYKNFENSTR